MGDLACYMLNLLTKQQACYTGVKIRATPVLNLNNSPAHHILFGSVNKEMVIHYSTV